MVSWASLTALTKLAEKKGYILVGCESTGCNAFFVKKNLALGKLPELTPEQAFYPQSRRLRIKSQKKTVRSD